MAILNRMSKGEVKVFPRDGADRNHVFAARYRGFGWH